LHGTKTGKRNILTCRFPGNRRREGKRNIVFGGNAKRRRKRNKDDWNIKFYNTLIISPRFHILVYSRTVFFL
jgi:hypothetical protein